MGKTVRVVIMITPCAKMWSGYMSVNYSTVKNLGGEKTLANLVNHNNLPTFFCQFSFFVT